ncbi:MAG: NAD+ synthase [Bacteroidia bacterium]|nr:NAD+ synthase [Bacteroidia bacterium]MDG2042884.1 NAD+ synthase [Bacteroidia bacterium]|tara:strand:- start:1447 stop:3084 length:1638 start_codon:yes stop_codon:yes gene_type:complete
MKIAISQLNYKIGDIDGNTAKILDAISKAKNENADLVIFSELAVCGYPPKDLLDYPNFIDRCEFAINLIGENSVDIGVIIGAPSWSKLDRGKKLYNSAFFYENKKLLKRIDKTLLPTYDVFDEYRYFESNKIFECVSFRGEKLAITICEDLWNIDDEKMYKLIPMDELQKDNPTLMINLSGSPYSYNHVEKRRNRMQQNAKIYSLPLCYVNQVGGNTDILFDGGSMFINKNGDIVEECTFYHEDFKLIEWSSGSVYPDNHQDYYDYDISLIHDALLMGIRDYFGKMGFKKAVIGSSGGIDSAVVHTLAAKALGGENVRAIMMPSKYSSEGSVNDAVALAKNLNSPYRIISIEQTVKSLNLTLEEEFEGLEEDVTEENIQARSRGVILMAISNKFGYIVLNTSNKSESAVGYSTLYGDMCGGLSVIGDLYKEQVYELARFMNRSSPVIPQEIIDKEPSAELRPNQKDSDSLPAYSVLDKILFHYIEEQKGWKEIVKLGIEEDLVRRIIRLVDKNEYKRFQASPTLRISHKAFGIGRQMPIVARYNH